MKIYLAHPFDVRKLLRLWELEVESQYDIEIVNPFYDLDRYDIDQIDAGRMDRYAADHISLVERDIDAIMGCDLVLAYVCEKFSVGTIQEMVYAKLNDIPVISVVTNGHDGHPWIKYHSRHIVTTLQESLAIIANIQECIH